MDLVDKIQAIASRIPQLVEHLQTEEATKMALIVPFLSALGWDVYNPLEVIPEYTADVGVKKGEKVDYAIMRDGSPIILVEAKKVGVNLEKEPASQLFRYFTVTQARVGVLTDGVLYLFYSDLEEPNKMDKRPFLEFNMRDFDEAHVADLKRFTKEGFNVDELLSAAVELKYTRAIKKVMSEELQSPSEELVRFFASKVYGGRMTQAVKEQFTEIVRRALVGFVRESVADRLKSALGDREQVVQETAPAKRAETLPDGVVSVDGEVVTTQDEVDAYLIVKAIVAGQVEPSRVVMRDTKSYCGILLDDNNRKPICRLRFNAKSKKYLGLMDAERNETRVEIERTEDIYQHADALRTTVEGYLG